MKRAFVFHPYLFAAYAILGIYSRNSLEVPVQWVVRPLIILLLISAVIFYILQIKSQDNQYAGLVTTLAVFWLFFGHFHRSLFEKSSFWNSLLGIFLALMIWTIPLFFIGSKWAWKRISNQNLITSFLNVTSVIVVLFPVYVAGDSWIKTDLLTRKMDDREPFISSTVLDSQSSQPDIYLIVLDAYGREDVLQDVYGFDNSIFVNGLRQKGFYVADQSTPNYPQTVLSLSSLLNMQYLDDFTQDFQDTSIRGPINNFVQQSGVRRMLQNAGYEFVAFPSASLSTQMRDADVFLDMTAGNLNEFEGLVLSSTIANLAIEALHLNVPVPGYNLHRQYILFSLDKLETIAKEASPKFVFVHIMAPHPPFVLDEAGKSVQPARPFNSGDASAFMGTDEEYREGYISEIQFLNKRIIDAVDAILSQSHQQPIIVIQGDHGPGNYFNLMEFDDTCLKERYSILNAYYFPDKNYELLYPTITPVNSFRIIFNQYFGEDLELLDDKNYYSGWFTPYVYTDISNQAQSCEISSPN